jgi:hypothetical protein
MLSDQISRVCEADRYPPSKLVSRIWRRDKPQPLIMARL